MKNKFTQSKTENRTENQYTENRTQNRENMAKNTSENRRRVQGSVQAMERPYNGVPPRSAAPLASRKARRSPLDSLMSSRGRIIYIVVIISSLIRPLKSARVSRYAENMCKFAKNCTGDSRLGNSLCNGGVAFVSYLSVEVRFLIVMFRNVRFKNRYFLLFLFSSFFFPSFGKECMFITYRRVVRVAAAHLRGR